MPELSDPQGHVIAFHDGEATLVDVSDRHSRVVPGDAHRHDDVTNLSERDRLWPEFVAMVAHDIRGPVTTVSGFLHFLRDRWEHLTAAEIEQYLDAAIGSAKRIERLVGDILTMSHIDSGAFVFDLRPTDLAKVAGQAVEEVGRTTGRRIDVSAPADLRPALADPDRQFQILTNLLTNAVKFSPDDSPIELEVTDDGDLLSVSVRDEGRGIPRDDHVLVFRPFSRLSDGTPGSGLGLYITKMLVEGQGGTIRLASSPGDGSTFSYTVLSADAPG